MCATVFVIGINEGEEIYIHSGYPLQPARFSYEDAEPWVKKGVLDIQSHSMDMHSWRVIATAEEMECSRCKMNPMKHTAAPLKKMHTCSASAVKGGYLQN